MQFNRMVSRPIFFVFSNYNYGDTLSRQVFDQSKSNRMHLPVRPSLTHEISLRTTPTYHGYGECSHRKAHSLGFTLVLTLSIPLVPTIMAVLGKLQESDVVKFAFFPFSYKNIIVSPSSVPEID